MKVRDIGLTKDDITVIRTALLEKVAAQEAKSENADPAKYLAAALGLLLAQMPVTSTGVDLAAQLVAATSPY